MEWFVTELGTELAGLRMKKQINYQLLLHARDSSVKGIIPCPKGRGKENRERKKKIYKLIINTISERDLCNNT